jgi:hypothetical protein
MFTCRHELQQIRAHNLRWQSWWWGYIYTVFELREAYLFKFLFLFKGTVPRGFRLLVFSNESVSTKHLSVPLRPFQIFSKIRGDIRGSRCTTGVVDTGGKWKNLQSEIF